MYTSQNKQAAVNALHAALRHYAPFSRNQKQGNQAGAKKADSQLASVSILDTDKPTYAGEVTKELTAKPEESVLKTQKTPAASPVTPSSPLMKKLSVVLSKRVREAAQKGQYAPNNVGVQYSQPGAAPAAPVNPLPIGAPPQQAAPAPAAQGQNPAAYQGALAGPGAISPSSNPINNYGPISQSGDINGNAAFGVKNSPDSSKTALDIFFKYAAVNYKGLSSGGQRWQLGQSGINPRIGYKYLGGVLPVPDVSIRAGFPGLGGGIGLDPLPYMFSDSGQPSGRFANSPRSFWKNMSDGFRSPEDSFFLELAGIEQGAGPERYEKLLRDRAIGSSSEEINAIAHALSESEDVKRQALTKRLPAGVNKLLPNFNPKDPKSLYAAPKGKQAPLISKIVAYQVDKAKRQAGQQKQAIVGWSKVKPVDVASKWFETNSNKPNSPPTSRNVYLPARRAATPRLLNRLIGDDPSSYYNGMSHWLSQYPEHDIYKGTEQNDILNRVNVGGESLKMWRPDIFKNSPRWDARLSGKSTPQIVKQLKKDVIEDSDKAQQQGRPVEDFEYYLTDAADAKKKPKKKAPAKSKSK